YYQVSLTRGHLSVFQFIRNKEKPINKFLLELNEMFDSGKLFIIDRKIIDGLLIKNMGMDAYKELTEVNQAGGGIELPVTILDDKAKLIYIEREVPNFGFNLESLIYNRKPIELDYTGSAYLAGLRENQFVLSTHLNLTGFDREQVIEVLD